MKTILTPPSESLPFAPRPDMPEPASRHRSPSQACRAGVVAAGVISPPHPCTPVTPSRGECAPSVADVMAAAGALGVNAICFVIYARLRWGRGWRSDAKQRALALDEIRRYRNDAEGFADKVDTACRLAGRSEDARRCP